MTATASCPRGLHPYRSIVREIDGRPVAEGSQNCATEILNGRGLHAQLKVCPYIGMTILLPGPASFYHDRELGKRIQRRRRNR